MLSLILAVITTTVLFAGCSSGGTDGQQTSGGGAGATYAFVAKDVNNPYMKKVYEGFQNACKELGVTALYKGPEAATPEKQIEIINQLVAQKVAEYCHRGKRSGRASAGSDRSDE